jgi:pyrroloquinoline quinone (PQQ) biosynthesis protein C
MSVACSVHAKLLLKITVALGVDRREIIKEDGTNKRLSGLLNGACLPVYQ